MEDWIAETLEYCQHRGHLCTEASVLAALKSDGMSTADALALVERLEQSGWTRYDWKTGRIVVTARGKAEIARREEPVA